MHRTTIMLPAGLKSRASRQARQMGISLGEFIRVALETTLQKSQNGARDPLFADEAVFDGPCESDLSANVDRYLYGDAGDLH